MSPKEKVTDAGAAKGLLAVALGVMLAPAAITVAGAVVSAAAAGVGVVGAAGLVGSMGTAGYAYIRANNVTAKDLEEYLDPRVAEQLIAAAKAAGSSEPPKPASRMSRAFTPKAKEPSIAGPVTTAHMKSVADAVGLPSTYAPGMATAVNAMYVASSPLAVATAMAKAATAPPPPPKRRLSMWRKRTEPESSAPAMTLEGAAKLMGMTVPPGLATLNDAVRKHYS